MIREYRDLKKWENSTSNLKKTISWMKIKLERTQVWINATDNVSLEKWLISDPVRKWTSCSCYILSYQRVGKTIKEYLGCVKRTREPTWIWFMDLTQHSLCPDDYNDINKNDNKGIKYLTDHPWKILWSLFFSFFGKIGQ